jgi:hypothetical protein
MNHELDTKNAIVKILEELLIDEYPQIKQVQVKSDVHEFATTKHYRYTVYLGITQGNMFIMTWKDINNMKKDAERYSRYVMGKNEKIENVVLYDPTN